jgi:PadR family transcriptional regulator, regulatory protein PadR
VQQSRGEAQTHRADRSPCHTSEGPHRVSNAFVPHPLTPDRNIARNPALVGRQGENLPPTESNRMTVPRDDLLQGTLDLLILKSLSLQPMHGWGVALRIQQISQDALIVNQGSLYPALHKLEREGLIQAEWGASENNRRAKFYSLTVAGRQQLDDELGRWERFTTAVALVLQTN